MTSVCFYFGVLQGAVTERPECHTYMHPTSGVLCCILRLCSLQLEHSGLPGLDVQYAWLYLGFQTVFRIEAIYASVFNVWLVHSVCANRQ